MPGDPVLTTRGALLAGFAASPEDAAGVGAFPQARSAGLLTPTMRVVMPEGPYQVDEKTVLTSQTVFPDALSQYPFLNVAP